MGECIHKLEDKETELSNTKYKENNLEKEQRKKNNKQMKLKNNEWEKKKEELKEKNRKIGELEDTLYKLNKQNDSIDKRIKVEIIRKPTQIFKPFKWSWISRKQNIKAKKPRWIDCPKFWRKLSNCPTQMIK